MPVGCSILPVNHGGMVLFLGWILSLGGEDAGVPVFPDWIEALTAEVLGNGCGASGVVDGELLGGPAAVAASRGLIELYPAAFDGEVEVVGAGSGVATGIGLGAC